MIRNAQKTRRISMIPGLHITANAFEQPMGTARILRNFYLEKKVLRNRLFNPIFSAAVAGTHPNIYDPIDVFNFRYFRASAPENKLLSINVNGQIFDRSSSWMQQIFPLGSQSALSSRPFHGQLGNRFFISDGMSRYVWDGRSAFQVWGLARSTTAPTVTAQNLAGSIVAATGIKGCFTWTVLDENSNRVHESSRSNVSAFVVVGGVDDSVRLDITGIIPPARATHWTAYISELDGSNIYRRAATTAINTLTVDITALPAATSPKAPIRNDPPPASTVGCVAKNRIFVRQDSAPNTFWFCALGEVRGLLNGSAEESFPGADGSNSISDISNSDTVPDREIRCFVEHENITFIFTESKGYALVGEMNLLDNRAPRSLVKLQQFSDGCIGPRMAVSTPFGLVWMSPTKKLWLWNGGAELIDIGAPVQPILDLQQDIFTGGASSFKYGTLSWYSGNGKQWLIFCNRTADWDDITSGGTNTYSGKMMILDFSLAIEGQIGSWYEWSASSGADASPVCVGQYQDDNGNVFLLFGDDVSNGIVQADVDATPAHLDYTCILGKTYLGSTVQTSPLCTLRSGLLELGGGSWFVADFMEINYSAKQYDGLVSSNTITAPTEVSWINVEDPDNPGTSISLTLDTALTSNDRRAWFVPQSSGGSNNTNIGGAFARHVIVQTRITSTDTEDIDTIGSRLTPMIHNINKLAVVLHPQKDMSQ